MLWCGPTSLVQMVSVSAHGPQALDHQLSSAAAAASNLCSSVVRYIYTSPLPLFPARVQSKSAACELRVLLHRPQVHELAPARRWQWNNSLATEFASHGVALHDGSVAHLLTHLRPYSIGGKGQYRLRVATMLDR